MSVNVDIIVILEHYRDDSDCSGVYDYNKLPQNVKDIVDKALSDEYKSAYDVEHADDGLQYLFHNNHPKINIGDVGKFKGEVEFWYEGY